MKKKLQLTMLSAIMIILASVPQLGYITVFGFTITIVHIPVLIGAVLFGKKEGLILGLVFGLSSMIKAILAPQSPFDLLFINPLVSVLPRAIFGYIVGLLKELFDKITKSSVSVILSSFISTFIHGVLVLTMLSLVHTDKVSELLGIAVENQLNGLVSFIIGILVSATLLEAAAGTIITLPIFMALKERV